MLYKERNRCGVAVEVIFPGDRPEFPVAKEAGEPHGTEGLLHALGVMMHSAEQPVSASVTATQTAPQHSCPNELVLRPAYQRAGWRTFVVVDNATRKAKVLIEALPFLDRKSVV